MYSCVSFAVCVSLPPVPYLFPRPSVCLSVSFSLPLFHSHFLSFLLFFFFIISVFFPLSLLHSYFLSLSLSLSFSLFFFFFIFFNISPLFSLFITFRQHLYSFPVESYCRCWILRCINCVHTKRHHCNVPCAVSWNPGRHH